jgi:antitoxin FitA
MAQVLVRNLKDTVVAPLKKRTKTRGRSLQAEVKTILEEAAKEVSEDFWKEAGRTQLGSGVTIE